MPSRNLTKKYQQTLRNDIQKPITQTIKIHELQTFPMFLGQPTLPKATIETMEMNSTSCVCRFFCICVRIRPEKIPDGRTSVQICFLLCCSRPICSCGQSGTGHGSKPCISSRGRLCRLEKIWKPY